ncbi:uncharacterized protein LOC143182993 [Calliopsis andreniformis]|uniref:uncharacterized protein LOC143182993 n=1 Tax=Calliopsis andreniformis TaxID=337506 RepID=UPI003FCECA09
MTPLPRWVLLALLLAGASAAPEDHACVRLCRAQNRGPKIVGVCDHQQKLVLQSSGGRFPLQRLFRLCLTPCSGGPGSPNDPLLFDDSKTCQNFRESLLRRRACSCDTLDHEGTWDLEEKNSLRVERSLENLEQYELKNVDSLDVILALSKGISLVETAIASDILLDQQGLNSRGLSEMKLEAEEDQVDEKEEEGVGEDPVVENAADGIDVTEEPPVDWDMWCMAQCDNGQGGSACHCDLIP